MSKISLASGGQEPGAAGGPVVVKKAGQPYALCVNNLQPVRWDALRETLDPDELIYVIDPEVEGVVLTDVGVCVRP